MRPILFLDIDGVLNNWESAKSTKGGWPPESIDEATKDHLRWDEDSFNVLRLAVVAHAADIVISSSWRLMTREDLWQPMFAAYGWEDAPIIGCTPRINSLNSIRGDEVREWLSQRYLTAVPHVILDDDADFHPDQPLVHIDGERGLRVEHIPLIRAVLEKQR